MDKINKEIMLNDNMIPSKFFMMDMNFMRDIVYDYGYDMRIITNTRKTNKNSYYYYMHKNLFHKINV